MNKAMKSLSAVLALTIGVATAGLVFADGDNVAPAPGPVPAAGAEGGAGQPAAPKEKEKQGGDAASGKDAGKEEGKSTETSVSVEALPAGAIALLVGKEEAKEAAKEESIFYSPKLAMKKYEEIIAKLDKEYKAFERDVKKKAEVEALACNTKVEIDKLDKEIAVADKLLELGKGAIQLNEPVSYQPLNDDKNGLGTETELLPANTYLSKQDKAKLDALKKTFNDLKAVKNILNKDDAFDGITLVYTHEDAAKLIEAIEGLEALKEKVTGKNYRDLLIHAKTHYGSATGANNRFLVELKAERDIVAGKVNALYVLGEKLGVKFNSKCLVPGGVPATPADAAPAAGQEKDNVPSTAAHR